MKVPQELSNVKPHHLLMATVSKRPLSPHWDEMMQEKYETSGVDPNCIYLL